MRYLIDTHTHTIASGHAYNTIDEMTRKANSIGLENLAITEHTPKMPGSCNMLYFTNLKILPERKYDVNRLFGCEANIVNLYGEVDMPDGLLRKMDIVIASFHIPCVKAGSVKENTRALINAMKNPYIDIIGHPDDSRYAVDMEMVVDAAKEYQTLLELNNSSLKPNGPRQGARENDIKMLELCKKKDVCITIGSDAHIEEDICNFGFAEELLEEVNFPDRLIVNKDIDLLNSYLHSYK
jgi:putative hydrolase